jgi:hypothetical protein
VESGALSDTFQSTLSYETFAKAFFVSLIQMSSVNTNTNAVLKANAKLASNIRNNVNGLFCKGYPFRYSFALFMLCLNVLIVLSDVFYLSHPLMISFNSLFVLLWYFVGLKKCYPITLFFAQVIFTLAFMLIMLFFFVHVLSTMTFTSVAAQ